MANHGHGHDEVIVSQTTPQGTQEGGVEYGHDERDIYVGSILKWLVGTAVGTALILLFLVGLFRYFDKVYGHDQRMPSPMYVQNPIPPEPRIEGFISTTKDKEGKDDYGPLYVFPGGKAIPRDGTPEELAVVRKEEEQKLDSFGIATAKDDHNDPHNSDVLRRKLELTPEQVRSVAVEGPEQTEDSNAKFAVQEGPSDASGGLTANPSR